MAQTIKCCSYYNCEADPVRKIGPQDVCLLHWMESLLESLEGDISSLKNQVDDLQYQVRSQQNQVDGLQSQVQSLENQVEDLRYQVNRLEA